MLLWSSKYVFNFPGGGRETACAETVQVESSCRPRPEQGSRTHRCEGQGAREPRLPVVLLCVNDVALQLPRVTLFQVGRGEPRRVQGSMFSGVLQRHHGESKHPGICLPSPGTRLLSRSSHSLAPQHRKGILDSLHGQCWEHKDSWKIRSWGDLCGLSPTWANIPEYSNLF